MEKYIRLFVPVLSHCPIQILLENWFLLLCPRFERYGRSLLICLPFMCVREAKWTNKKNIVPHFCVKERGKNETQQTFTCN